MKNLLWLLLLLLPFCGFSQLSITASRSHLLAKNNASWTSGIGLEYGLAQGRSNLLLSFNKVHLNNVIHREYAIANPLMQTDSSFGLHWHQIKGDERDLRIGYMWREHLGKISMVVGLEGVLGLTRIYLTEAQEYYELSQDRTRYQQGMTTATVAGSLPTRVRGFATDQQYMKLGIAPQIGFRYQVSPPWGVSFLMSTEFANRRFVREEHSFDGPSLQSSQFLNLDLNQVLLQWKLSYTFLRKADDTLQT